jgi:integrase/recombinase XerD
MKTNGQVPALLESFFTDRLMRQLKASAHTITSYRDTFRLLLQYIRQSLRKPPSDVTIPDLDAPLIGAFLDHLEKARENTARSRNLRLAAIRSFFRYVAIHAPEYSAVSQRVLSMKSKRHVRRPVSFLTSTEIDALLAAPVLNCWSGRRDRALLLLSLETGLRASEITSLRCENLMLGVAAHVRCEGKGRKERCTPLRKSTVAVLRAWLKERRGQAVDPLFPAMRGEALGYDGLDHMLNKHLAVARKRCSSLRSKKVTFHSLRHSRAMSLLSAGADRSVIALFLGHERVETTSMYLHADMQLKEQALAKARPINSNVPRYRPDDRLLTFLKGL